MKNFKGKRAFAFIIDSIIISLIIGLVSRINVLNPMREDYLEAAEKYQEYYQNSVNNKDYTINEDVEKVMYDVAYYGMSYTIIEFGVIILYFTFFPLVFNGQTIGKKIVKIRIVNNDNKKKVSIFRYLLRSLIYPVFSFGLMYCAITVILNLGVLLVFKQSGFITGNKILLVLGIVWGYADTFYCLKSKDDRSLHDLVCKTKVISEDNV